MAPMRSFVPIALLLGIHCAEGAPLAGDVNVCAFNTVDDEAKYPSRLQIDWIENHTVPNFAFDIVGVIENMGMVNAWYNVNGFSIVDFKSTGTRRQPEQVLYRTSKFQNPSNIVQYREEWWGPYYVSHVDLEETAGGGCVRVFAVHLPIETEMRDGPSDKIAYEMGDYVAANKAPSCSNIVTGDFNTLRFGDWERNYERLTPFLNAGFRSFQPYQEVADVLYILADIDFASGTSATISQPQLSDHRIAVTVCAPEPRS
eukprot:TRINITY_DN3019_c0_g2_i1.p1 TRINITY_DN3019_c0_g2~~TRINITY_DN3019_c0_g2_i1.p1  ORF type:complete len:258 (+),score=78.81 TRINITY_DN3019_c0_g2_i1:503-1276(+)